MSAGGPIPASLRLGLPSSSEQVEVKAGGSNVTHLVVDNKVLVKWNFKVVEKDINFFGFFTPLAGDLSEVDMTKVSGIPSGSVAIAAPSKVTEGVGEYLTTSEGFVTLVGGCAVRFHWCCAVDFRFECRRLLLLRVCAGVGQHVLVVQFQVCGEECVHNCVRGHRSCCRRRRCR